MRQRLHTLAFLVPLLIFTACPSENQEVTLAPTPTPAPGLASDDVISGDFPTVAILGALYEYTPTAKVAGAIFSIQNKPDWATFSTGTGTLSGTPTVAATHADIKVTGTAGTSSETLAFTITVTTSGSVISGSFPTTGQEEVLYEYTPTALVAGATFSIQNKPSWATFSTSTGKLSGFPNYGTYSNIRVSGTAGGKSNTLTFTITVGGDPLTAYSWHLHNSGQSTFSKSNGTAGQDMKARAAYRMGYTGQGVKVAVTDTGLEIAHEDLAPNVLAGKSRNYAANPAAPTAPDPVAPYTGNPTNLWDTEEDHGTSVTGIIGAKAMNSLGARGIAPNAGIAGLNFINSGVKASVYPKAELDQTQGDFDIFNQSWGLNFGAPRTSKYYAYYSGVEACYRKSIKYGVDNLRGGKGAIYIRAAGNDFEYDNFYRSSKGHYLSTPANLDYLNTLPYQIVVGAMNATGKKSSYSTSGSALWIAGLGGEYGVDAPAILSTDMSSCDFGLAPHLALAYQDARPPLSLPFDNGSSALNPNCNYTGFMNGTSAATPSIAGVVALMLEAKPSLGWRDVKHILAKTATKVDASIAPVTRPGLDVSGYVYEDGWTQNKAGYNFHNWYGFGRADAEAAINLAKTHTPTTTTYTETNWASDSGTLNTAIPNNNKDGVSFVLNVPDHLSIEAVQIQVTMDHLAQGQVALELYSPQGTKSIVMNGYNGIRPGPAYAFGDYNPLADLDPRNNSFCGTNYTGAVFLSNAFYGEDSHGDWTLKVIDVSGDDVSIGGTVYEATGSLINWKINIAGH